MACTVDYNQQDGSIKKVNTSQGTESKLFNQIARLPFVNTLTEALNVYKNKYSKKLGLEDKGLSPEESTNFANLTEDGQGNFVFYHVGDTGYQTIKRGTGQNSATSIQEATAMNKVGGLAMYYPAENVGETVVTGNAVYLVKVAKDKVYDFNRDPLNFLEEAREEFEKEFPGQAFDTNTQLAFVTKVANDNGYEAVVANWNNTTRVQTTKELVPADDKLLDGNIVLKDFKSGNKFISNKDKGWKVEPSVMRRYLLAEVYAKIEAFVGNEYSNPLYRVKDMAIYGFGDRFASFNSQEEITEVINNSELPQEIKDEYAEVLRSEDASGFSYMVEPTLVFRSDKGNDFQTYKEALKDSSGGTLEVGISVAGEMMPLMAVSTNTNPQTYEGFINNLIKEDILADTKLVEDGKSFFQAAGFDPALQLVNEKIIREQASQYLNRKNVIINKDGRIELKNEINSVQINGNVVSIQEVRQTPDDQLRSKFGTETGNELVVNNMLNEFLQQSSEPVQEVVLKEDDLKIKLLDLLNEMGVKVTSISSYLANYKTRNGVEPTSQALVDIANQVIAFKDGAIPLEALLEETAHFIVEAWDEVEIENLLRNINKTKTYQEFSTTYREIYRRENPNISEEELENLVRREILGKELAKSIQERFSTEGKTEIQASITQRIYDFFANFFNNLFVNDDYRRGLEDLTLKVSDLILNKNIANYLNLNQTLNKKFNMYQAPVSGSPAVDTKSVIVKKLVKVLLDQEKTLIRSGIGSRAEAQRLNDALDTALTVSSALDLVKLSKRYASYLSDAIRAAKQNSKTLSNEEGIVLYNLKENITPLLERLNVIAMQDAELKSIQPDIETALRQIGEVKGEVANAESTILKNIIDRLMERHNIVDPKIRLELEKAVENAAKDTQLLYSWFGQITHANDPLLGLLGSVIGDLSFEAEVNYQQRQKRFEKMVLDLGFKEGDLQKLYDKEGYVLSIYDFSEYEKQVLDIKVKGYIKHANSNETEESVAKQIQDRTLPVIQDKQAEANYKKEVTDKINDLTERAFTQEFYDKRDARLQKVSEPTRAFLKMVGTDLGEFMAKARTESGLPRYRYQDRYNLDGINLRRKAKKSLFNDFGILKAGIIPADTAGPDTIESSGQFYRLEPSPSEDALIAFEIHQLDKEFMDEKNAKALANGGVKMDLESLAPKFLTELQRIEREEGREAAEEFFLLNSTIGFAADFWNNYDTSNSMGAILDEYLEDPNGDVDTRATIRIFKKFTEQRKQIIKRYQDSKNYTNILASEIPSETKKEIIALSEEIDKLSAELYTKFEKQLSSEDDPELKPVEYTSNQAYKEALVDNRITTIKEKLDFAYNNMTSENRRKVSRFNDALDDLRAGLLVQERQRKIVKKLTGLDSLVGMSDAQLDAVKLKYAESKLAPYYRAFAPLGLEQFYQDLKTSQRSVFALVSEMNQQDNVKLSNNFSYYELGEIEFKNKNYKENFEGGPRQPKLSQFLNKKFVETFAPVLDSSNNPILDGNGEIQVTKNQKLFTLYQEYLKFQKESLASMDENGLHNIYLAPQISKTTFQKVQSLAQGKKGTLKDWWKDITRFRVDELAFGETVEGESLSKTSNIRMLPKYFMRKLENANDVTEDLFYSSALFAQQAELYKAKKNRFSEFSTLNDKALSRGYPEGKAAEATNTFKMFKSYLDYNLFGIKEMKQWRVSLPLLGEVDLTKIVDVLHTWLRNNSLAFNIVVPATSWLTAETTLFVEKLLGQYVDKRSMSMATSEFLKLSTDAMKESFEINSTSKLSLIGERFRVFDLNNRFENSIYSKGTRNLGKSGYILHTAANFVPLSKAMLSQLFGIRVYEGKVVDFNKFLELRKLVDPKITTETGKKEWILLEDKNLYNYITIDSASNTMSYDYNKLATDMGKTPGAEFEADFKNIEYGVATKIKKLIERIDGQISPEEKTTLQRHVLGRFTMTHKGWLSIAAANRFKRKHFNFQTGAQEEGSYLSAFNAITNSINLGIKEGGVKGVLKSLKNVYKNGSYVEQENMRRVLIETSIMQIIFAMGLLISGWADDEDEMAIAQLTAYLFERVATETASSQLGVMGEFYSSVQEPIVGLNKIENLIKVQDLFNTDVIDRGRYKGLTKQESYFIKNVVGAKGIFDLSSAKNLKSQRDAYDFFNKEEALIPAAYFLDEEGSGALIEY